MQLKDQITSDAGSLYILAEGSAYICKRDLNLSTNQNRALINFVTVLAERPEWKLIYFKVDTCRSQATYHQW